MPSPANGSSGHCAGTVRNATPQDMPELRRLFYAMMAEAGLDNFNIGKVQKRFERGIKRDGGILLVATGKPTGWLYPI